MKNNRNNKERTVALILAGYDKIDPKTKRKRKKELKEYYDGEIIYLGRNKFLEKIGHKTVLQYVIDTVYSARDKDKPVYESIYVYNDVDSMKKDIDQSAYTNVNFRQMKGSVGENWKDFYFNEISYGDRVDVFFGDTPRITPDDVLWVHKKYSEILGKIKDHRGITVYMSYGIVRLRDLKNDWMMHRHRYIKRGKNKGKLKYFVGFEDYQARIGNTGSMIKHSSLDALMENEVLNFFYNLRKALTPSVFSKIIYNLMKTKNFELVRQVKNKSIKKELFIDSVFDIISKVYKIDVSRTAGEFLVVSENAAHWENDIDTPSDLEIMRNNILGKTEK